MPTKIEWAKNPDGTNGETWNPVTGCTKVSAGCANCYAERMARRLAGRHGYPPAPHHFDVTLRPDRLYEPLRWKKPRMVFVCSMGDLFHPSVPFQYIQKVVSVTGHAYRHTFQILTKRPERVLDYISWWGKEFPSLLPEHEQPFAQNKNVRLGVTVENSDNLWRVEELLKVRASVYFVSYEPALGRVDFSQYLKCQQYAVETTHRGQSVQAARLRPCLDWIIAGGETGPRARPAHPDWVRNVRDQCIEAGVPFFFKQWGEYTPCPVYDAPDMSGGRAFDTPGGRMAAAPGNRRGYKWLDENLVAYKCGKRTAGHLLDGQEWRQFPQ